MKFPYGESNFKKIRTQGYFYVDKTRYIEILEKNLNIVKLSLSYTSKCLNGVKSINI